MIIKNLLCAAAASPLARSACLVAMSIAASLAAGPAGAVTDFSPYATVNVMHNSNLFARESDEPPFASQGNTQLGDNIQEYLAGLTGNFSWDRESLLLTAEGSLWRYNRFDELDHNEQRYAGLFAWHLGPIIDGSLDVTHTRTMAGLADTLSDRLDLQTEDNARGTVRILLSPQWRFDLEPSWHELKSPLSGFADFGYHETSGAAALNYLGIAKLTAGLRDQYTQGSYFGIIGATRYHQNTTELTADYAVSGFSSFEGHVGYTKRDSTLINPADAAFVTGAGGLVGRTSDLTGSLAFRRELSVKTSINARIFREIDSYVVGANSMIGTGGEAGIRWDPDVKFSVSLSYRQQKQLIQGDLAIADFVNRTDHDRTTSLEVKYFATRWLTVRPYFTRDQRTSNFRDANYTSNLFGVDLTAKFDRGAGPTP